MTAIEHLAITDGDEVLAVPCLEIIAMTTTPRPAGAEGLAHFYAACRQRFGGTWRFVQAANSKRTKKVTEADLDLVPFWLSDARSLREPMIGVLLHSGSEKEHWGLPSLQFHFYHVYPPYPRGIFRVCIPVSAFEQDPDGFHVFLTDALSKFPLAWGFVGYSMLWNYLLPDIDSRVKKRMPSILKRHPGLSYGYPGFYQAKVEQGLGHVGWITLLGSEYVERLGGVAALKERTKGSELRVLKLGDHAVGLQAGPEPSAGDVNRGETLPLRREVGRIVAPVRITDEAIERTVSIDEFEVEDARTWFRRFFSDAPAEDE